MVGVPGLALPDRFRVLRKLGEGGMGIVYEALDADRGVRVALKTIREPSAETLARFKREFRALHDVNHPNLVSLGELVSHQDQWFFTMELIEGTDIVSWIRPEDGAFAVSANDPTTELPPMSHASGHFAIAPRQGTFGLSRRFDEERLRAAMRQLASGLAAMHEAGMVHRDVKPTNVRVDGAGRTVLLDFGLVLDVNAMTGAHSMHVAGTPIYMAPEQAASDTVGPEADWYAFGVMLFEALTGTTPFDGPPLEVMLRKQRVDPPRASALVPDVPADLDDLCARLLLFDPKARPKGGSVLRALGAAAEANRSRSFTEQAPFVGRACELEILREALGTTRKGGAVTAVVRGESGVGKSCLVRRFVETCAIEDPTLMVLAGRCYEREAVPYKAFDGVVDAMTRLLLRLGGAEASIFAPARTDALTHVFPVLGRLPGFRRSGLPRGALDPHELRARAFAALREMLARIGERHPLVVLIDDIQWADADSLALLAELMRPPDEPTLLLVATMRVANDASAAADRARIFSALTGDVRTIELRRLASDEARALAKELLERFTPGEGTGAAEAIAEGAEGHPLFIDALVRHRALADEPPSTLRLEDALWAHVEALDERARRLTELLAVAGAPLQQEVLAAAAGDEHAADFARLVSQLRVAHLVNISGGRAIDAIDVYHDRVRTAVVAHLDAESVRLHHASIAHALERLGRPDPEALAIHWRGAGEAKTAGKYAEQAADAAAAALAFDRAAQWYEAALELGAPNDAARRSLNERLGEALADAGRGAPAAAYRRAAEGAPAAQRLDLQRRAADQLLRGGLFDEGLEALRGVLASIGMRLPATPWLALVTLLLWRAWIRVRGLDFRVRDATEVAASELTKVDTCWSVAFGLAMVDNIRGASFQARHLALALATGERGRIQRAFAIELPYVARGGTRSMRRLEMLIERTDRLTIELGDPYAAGFRYAALALAYQLVGRFRAALEASESAEVFLRACAGTQWELANARVFAIMSLARLGRIRELCQRQPFYARDAAERGDVYASSQFRIGFSSWRWVAEDGIGQGRAELRDAMKVWSGRRFHTEHYFELLSHVKFDLYEGEAWRAYQRVVDIGGPLRGSLLLLVESVRLQTVHARATTAVAAARVSKAPAALLARAARDASTLERYKLPWTGPVAKLLRAEISVCRRGPSDAQTVELLRDAASMLVGADMALHAATARRALGVAVGGDEGTALVREADEWMRGEGIRAPERVAAVLVPTMAVRR